MILVKNNDYRLEINGHRVGVIIDGCPFVELDMRSSVNVLSETKQVLEDVDDGFPVLTEQKKVGYSDVFIWKSKSNLWEEKTYTMVCDPVRFRYSVSVKGKGAVDGVQYFNGHGHDKRALSCCEFQDAFTPNVSMLKTHEYTFRALGECERMSCFFTPPMFCYAFRCEGISRRLGLGLVAERGEHNFHMFRLKRFGDFWLETDQHGHTHVDGEWTAPYIIGYAAENDMDAMDKYCTYYRVTGIAKPSRREIPRFWRGPIACGWIEQFARPDTGIKYPTWRACEQVYREYVDRLHQAGMFPRILIIDDKWQKEYGTNIADPEHFPDMRKFVDDMHAKGIHVMLWIRMFSPEGMPDECVLSPDIDLEGGTPGKQIDPSHPTAIKIIKESIHRMLSDEPGCYNCDGFKLDFESMNPAGRNFETYSGKYGAELLYDYFVTVYDAAKAVKPDAIINCSACHPYFAHIVDQARLHDYAESNHNCREERIIRGSLFHCAAPYALIDTDTCGYGTRRDSVRAMLAQPQIGVPDMYAISALGWFSLKEEDLKVIAHTWQEYIRITDSEYGECPVECESGSEFDVVTPDYLPYLTHDEPKQE